MKDEEEISRLLASLKTVDAPENFAGVVRSRIAVRRDERSRSGLSLWLVAKFAFPLLLLIAVGGYLMVPSDRDLSLEMVPPVVEGTHEVAVIEEPRHTPIGNLNTSNGNSQVAQIQTNRGGETSRPVGGSQDKGLGQDETTHFPDGVDPRQAKKSNIDLPPVQGISPNSLLSMMGILSVCTPQSCQVREVVDASLARKAGVRVGDLITKIGNRPIDSFPSTSFEVKSIEINRDGKAMTISIGRP